LPFPGSSPAEKLLKHSQEEPAPVEKLRPDVPLGVAAVVRKLMAKRPEDRYQTPAEVAAALAALVPGPRPGADRRGATRSSGTARGRAKRRLGLALGACAGCALAVMAVWTFRSGNQGDSRPATNAAVLKSTPGATVPRVTDQGKPFANTIGMKLAPIAP